MNFEIVLMTTWMIKLYFLLSKVFMNLEGYKGLEVTLFVSFIPKPAILINKSNYSLKGYRDPADL